jgi:hypothetical protein
MITRLVRWPNGTLSIVSAEDEQSIIKQLTKDGVGIVEENDSPHGMVIDVPAGFTIHLHLTDEADFEFQGFAADSMPTSTGDTRAPDRRRAGSAAWPVRPADARLRG